VNNTPSGISSGPPSQYHAPRLIVLGDIRDVTMGPSVFGTPDSAPLNSWYTIGVSNQNSVAPYQIIPDYDKPPGA